MTAEEEEGALVFVLKENMAMTHETSFNAARDLPGAEHGPQLRVGTREDSVKALGLGPCLPGEALSSVRAVQKVLGSCFRPSWDVVLRAQNLSKWELFMALFFYKWTRA